LFDGRVYGRRELAEHYAVDIIDLPDEMFALRGRGSTGGRSAPTSSSYLTINGLG
jgi:hypothetical protein